MKRIHLQPAYVLHRRSYRETSFLVEIFTPDHGRTTIIARGVRTAKSASPGLLQSFVPLTLSFSGKGELMTLTQVEPRAEVRQLQGECLFAGFYLNELLMCLLQKWDAHPGLFKIYEEALIALQSPNLEEKTLRIFEKKLLEELGYALFPKEDVNLQPEKFYRFIPEHGFILSELGDQSQAKSNIFSGKSLLAYADGHWPDVDTLQDAKRLTRLVIGPLLGTKVIHSRKLFVMEY